MATFTVNTHHAYLNNEIVIKANGQIIIEDTITGDKYEFQDELKIHLSAGRHILVSEEHEEVIFIEDAIKLGGSRVKKAFVFDHNPWIFVTTKDRLYFTNIETQEEKVEYNITPDEIMSLPPHVGKVTEFFLLKTYNDYAIYNVLNGQIVFQFTNYIYSNGHLVIFKQEDGIEVYDFRMGKTVVHFDGQYSFGSKFFYVKDKVLYGLNLNTSYINSINYVNKVSERDMLLGNHLLRLNEDYSIKKKYIYFSLGNGESEKSMSKTELISPYYIESWNGETTPHFFQAKEDLGKFKEECRKITRSFANIHNLCLGIKITSEIYHWKAGIHYVELHGEYIAYPTIRFSVPFIIEGIEGESIDFTKYAIALKNCDEENTAVDSSSPSYSLDKGERKIGESSSKKLIITQDECGIYLRELIKGEKHRILNDLFDTSNYASAYFTSDGKSIFLRVNNTEAHMFGLESLNNIPFEVESFTLAKNEGYNGYKPEVMLTGGRKPVWRDPITLNFISEKDMSSHIFRSPNGDFFADIQMKSVLYNRLTKAEISLKDVAELESKYNWNSETKEEEKNAIIKLRKDLAEQSDKYDLFGKIIDANSRCFSNLEDEKEKEKKRDELTNKWIEQYITKEHNFVALIVDRLGYVCYRKNETSAEEKRILIGRNVYFLNYVSFSYDSKYLSFAAKMKEDEFRSSQEGVFVIFDLKKEEVVRRIERVDNHQLWAVWMTMFSKNGDVAFYDSCANAYLANKDDNYMNIKEASGKSLLCFSPSGKLIAFSDQNYIDFAHHPNENWGHQPSGNVFIHAVNEFDKCIEQYNDLGDSISGVASRAGNVSSAAFSQDETKLLIVGDDGVVVVRNLKLNKKDKKCNKKDYDDIRYNSNEDDYGTHYGEYAGSYAQDVMGYSDDVINDAFDGDPDAYWNID